MAAPDPHPDKRVVQQLDRILNSKCFHSAGRLKRFLKVIVSETLNGHGDQLKEFVVGEQVFDKGASFDPRNDPIVRVQARRLRTRLARYYVEEGQHDETIIELPKGGYTPAFRRRDMAPAKRAIESTLASRNRVTVLPFEDLSIKGNLGYLCKGFRQEIVRTLTTLERVRVVASASAKTLNFCDTRTLAESMDAATIVCGSIQSHSDKLRITSELIDSVTGCYLWSESIDRSLDSDIFELQSEVARLIADRVKMGLSEKGWTQASRHNNENLLAYNLYQQGRYHLNQRTEEGLKKSVGLFERVIVEDPHHALAFAGLADAYELLGHYGVLAPVEVWTQGPLNARWAVFHDDQSSEAHTSLAHVKATQEWDWLSAEHEFLRALRLDPRNPTAHHWYAMSCLAPMGRLDEAREELQVALALDPISSIIARDCAMVRYYRREMEDALEQCDQTIELNPHFSPAYWTLGLIQEQLQDFDESIAAFQRAIQLTPNSPRMKGALGRILALCGKREGALKILGELHTISKDRYVSPFELALLHFALGDSDVGFNWLQKAFQDRCFELVAIKVDPRFDFLKSDPAFRSLSDQLGLQPSVKRSGAVDSPL